MTTFLEKVNALVWGMPLVLLHRKRVRRKLDLVRKNICFFAVIAGVARTGTITQINGITTAAEVFLDP